MSNTTLYFRNLETAHEEALADNKSLQSELYSLKKSFLLLESENAEFKRRFAEAASHVKVCYQLW
jgi:hypothetical protein